MSCETTLPEMPDIEFIPTTIGFQNVTVTKGVSSWARHNAVLIDIYVKNGQGLNREVLRTWLSDFTGPSAAMYVAGGTEFVLRRTQGKISLELKAQGRSMAYPRLFKLEPSVGTGMLGRIQVQAEKLEIPPVKSSTGLYFFRGVLVEEIRSLSANVREIDFAAEKAMQRFVQELDKQGIAVSMKGTFYLAEHKIVLLNETHIGVQISLYADFK